VVGTHIDLEILVICIAVCVLNQLFISLNLASV